MTRGRKQSNNYEREMTSVVALSEAVSKNYELPTYYHRARTKAETTWTTNRLGAQIRISVRGRPRGSARVKENFAAIYIGAAMPHSPVPSGDRRVLRKTDHGRRSASRGRLTARARF